MGKSARLKALRRKAAALVAAELTPEMRARAAQTFYEHGIFNEYKAAKVLAKCPPLDAKGKPGQR